MIALSEDHPTGLAFLDETRDERYFGVGCLTLRDPFAVLATFTALRRKHKFGKKLRWADLGNYTEAELEFSKEAALMLAKHAGAEFVCVLTDLAKVGGMENYGPVAEAYIRLAARAIGASARDPDELLAAIADHFDASPDVDVEGRIKRSVNGFKGRLAAVAVQRVASAGTDGLQLADLMLGAIAHQFRSAGSEEVSSAKADISLALLVDGYELTAYHDASGGRSIDGRLTVELLPQPNRRGRRGAGGRRHR